MTRIYNNNISIPYRLLIPHFVFFSSSLVFSFGKFGTGLLFSFLVSLTKSPNEFRSKLSILYITLIHLNWHKIILQTKYSCILTFSIEQFLIYLFDLKNHGKSHGNSMVRNWIWLWSQTFCERLEEVE
ncbi:hypothetical protein ACJX0J_009792 [Zea mays]